MLFCYLNVCFVLAELIHFKKQGWKDYLEAGIFDSWRFLGRRVEGIFSFIYFYFFVISAWDKKLLREILALEMGLEAAEEGSWEMQAGFWLEQHHKRVPEFLWGSVQLNIPGSTVSANISPWELFSFSCWWWTSLLIDSSNICSPDQQGDLMSPE